MSVRHLWICDLCRVEVAGAYDQPPDGWLSTAGVSRHVCPECGAILRSPHITPSSARLLAVTESVALEQVNLSTRLYNTLKRADIHDTALLAMLSEDDLGMIRNFGARAFSELRATGLPIRRSLLLWDDVPESRRLAPKYWISPPRGCVAAMFVPGRSHLRPGGFSPCVSAPVYDGVLCSSHAAEDRATRNAVAS
jgi:hypothetical protein